MEKITATVGILTFNSAATLARTLESVQMFDDILICDGGSTDDTLSIAAQYGARVIAQDARFKDADGRLRDFGGVRQQMLEAAARAWFLYLDSDETISDGLREDIRRITREPVTPQSALVYRVPIGIILDRVEMHYSSNFPGYQYRFFNTVSGAHFIKRVHERIEFDRAHTRIGTLAHPWNTYVTRDEARHYLRETAGYRAIEARMYAARPWSHFFYYIVLRGVRASLGVVLKSLRNYLVHGFSRSMPVATEWGRFAAPYALMWATLRVKLRLI